MLRLFIPRLAASTIPLLSKRCYSNGNEWVGFIGLGAMGAPMANNLLQKGKKLIVYDVVDSAMKQAVSAGARHASSPAEIASETKTIITMLPAAAHVLECYNGTNGIFSTVQSNSLLIDSSTIDQATVNQVFTKANELNVNYIDAPVSGGVGAATKGILTFMVGGPKESCDQATPLLECMGRAVFYCGDSGAGQAAKICNNMLLGISMIGTSEALQLGINLGLDPKRLSDVINKASGRCWSSDTYNPCPGVLEGVPSNNDYQGGFKTGLMAKDLGLAMEASGNTKSVTPLGAHARQMYQLMCERGFEGRDFSSVFKFIEKNKSTNKD